MTKEIGDPDFPVTKVWEQYSTGMTLRDYFAAKAMSAVLGQQDVHDGREDDNAAFIAYRIADAMLKARTE